ncbi:MAG: hypothetical protein EXR67_06880 [Dehalococcoidia bacterium]|nr:hypothetical protein [Dehalococcoidia bacterium]
MSNSWILAALPILILWGFWGFLVRLAVERLGWRTAWLVEGVTVACVYAAAFLLVRPALSTAPKTGLAFAVLAGLAAPFGAILFYFVVERTRNASVVVPFTALYPVVTIALAFLILHEKVSTTQLIGIVFAVLAAVFLAL